MSQSVAIIGAGWAGLSAAVRLADAGCRVTVFESARQAGGRARRVEWDGTLVDNGQHLLVGAYAETLDMLRQVGVDTDKVLQRITMTVAVPGRLTLRLPRLPAPFHLAFGLLDSNGASLREKFSAALFMQKLKAARYRLPADLPVAEWLDQHHQQGVLRTHLWEPLCLAALNTRPAEASAQVFANVLRDTLGSTRRATDMLLPATDLGQLFPDAALRHLVKKDITLRLATRVTAIRPAARVAAGNGPGGWHIDTRSNASSASLGANRCTSHGAVTNTHPSASPGIPAGDREWFNHVIIATAPHHAAALLPTDHAFDATRDSLAGLGSEPIATIYLQYPASVRLPHPLIAINHGAAQWLADRGQLGGPAGLLAHVLSAHGEWEKYDNQALATQVHQDTNVMLEKYRVMAPLPVPTNHLVIREHRATFRCSPGLKRPPGATPWPSLWLAGDYVASDYPGTLESAVRSGNSAALAILTSPGQQGD